MSRPCIIYRNLLPDATYFLQERLDGGATMNRYYKCLDNAGKKYVKDNRDSYKKRNNYFLLDDRTVEECMAKVLCSESRKEYLTTAELDKSICDELSRSLAIALGRYKKNPRVLKIYNGYITTSILQKETFVTKASTTESLELVDGRNQILWQDIVNMSLIYGAIERGIENEGYVKVSAEDIYKTLCPGYYDDEYIGRFSDDLNNTIEKFNGLSGNYEVVKDGKKKSYTLSSKFFFDYEGTDAFGESGFAMFRKSMYQQICDSQKRIVEIKPKYLFCDSIDESYILSYLVYRHDFSRKTKHSISFGTMRRVLGKDAEGDFSYETMAFSMRRWVKSLKGLFKGRKIGFDSITWKEEEKNED